MNIGIVTTWLERGATYVSRAYMDVLGATNNIYVYARGGEKGGEPGTVEKGGKITWAARSNHTSSLFIEPNDFRRWVVRNRLEACIFNEQSDWEIVCAIQDLPIKLGVYIDSYNRQTVPFFGLYDFLLCNTARHYSVFKDHPQAFFIPWGTDISLFCPKTEEYKKGDLLTFFHSCGWSPWRKGTDILIRAFTRVRGECRLVIHSIVELEEQRVGALDSRIHVVKKEVPAPGLYHLGHVYVYPTRSEGIGLTIAEALACGLPVVTTDCGPMNEFVVDGLNGKLVPRVDQEPVYQDYYWPLNICDEERLVALMQQMVDDPQSAREMGRRARVYAEEKLDWRKNAAGLSVLIANAKICRHVYSAALLPRVRRYNRTMTWIARLSNLNRLLRAVGAGTVLRAVKRRFLGGRA